MLLASLDFIIVAAVVGSRGLAVHGVRELVGMLKEDAAEDTKDAARINRHQLLRLPKNDVASDLSSAAARTTTNSTPQLTSKEKMAQDVCNIAHRGACDENTDGKEVESASIEANMKEVHGSSSLYGEIISSSVFRLLRDNGMVAGKSLIDLGAGKGHVVMLAGLMGLNAVGVELAEARWERACCALELAKRDAKLQPQSEGNITLFNANCLDLDFSGADLVFADINVNGDMLPTLSRKLACTLKKGTPIVTYRGLHLNASGIKQVASWKAPTTWSPTGADFNRYETEGACDHAAKQQVIPLAKAPAALKHCGWDLTKPTEVASLPENCEKFVGSMKGLACSLGSCWTLMIFALLAQLYP